MIGLGDQIAIFGKSTWRYEFGCNSVGCFSARFLQKEVCYFHSNFKTFCTAKKLTGTNSIFSELSVFANNSTKAGVIVETMSAPNPVRLPFNNPYL